MVIIMIRCTPPQLNTVSGRDSRPGHEGFSFRNLDKCGTKPATPPYLGLVLCINGHAREP